MLIYSENPTRKEYGVKALEPGMLWPAACVYLGRVAVSVYNLQCQGLTVVFSKMSDTTMCRTLSSP